MAWQIYSVRLHISVSRMGGLPGAEVSDLAAECTVPSQTHSALTPAAHHYDTQVRSGRQLAAGQFLSFTCLFVVEIVLDQMARMCGQRRGRMLQSCATLSGLAGCA